MKLDTSRLSRRAFLKIAPTGTLALLLAACGLGETPPPPPPSEPTATPLAISPEPTARAFLTAWQHGDYPAMYALLAPTVQAAITPEAFAQRYQGIFAEATIYQFEPVLVATGITGPTRAAADFDVLYKTRLAGDLRFRPRLAMTLVDGNWMIDWTPAVIIPQLGTDNRLRLFPRTSTRGIIYDRNGEIMATQGAIVTLGVVPGQIENEGQVQALLSELLGQTPGQIKAKYTDQPDDWFIPIGDIAFETAQSRYDQLSSTPGVAMRERAVRSYPLRQTASHIVGYVAPINAEELAALGERGYEETDRVGKLGIEKAVEEILAGKKGGRLAILTPEGQEVVTLADIPAVQSRSVTLTLDLPLQRACEEILGERLGAICVLDVATGRVLALASWPRFDPNALTNELDVQKRLAVAAQPGQPLVNRATQGVYPCGSVFKIVSMAAALEKGGFTVSSGFNCPGFWDTLGIRMLCWKRSGHGNIDLFQGLVQSCDVVFYEVGYTLYKLGVAAKEELLQSVARGFGLGRPSGVELDEAAGLVPDNEWKLDQLGQSWTPGDTVNLAVGQGYLLTTPLQIANVTAAVANGGSLHRPTLLLQAVDVTGTQPPQEFGTESIGALPVSPEHLDTIRRAMAEVTTPPLGTASETFGTFPIKVAGKTGTAQHAGKEPHAWFTAYAPADQPQVAVCAMFEEAGEGSKVAAPAVRSILERFFRLG
ncbi:MAG TPA: penicillin-binding protein 2 [Chloroflexi bacterium]|nr:penicillin-binding protein 2 [Chloroflexota bacterium]